jgi:hypothetical protein
VIVAAINVAVMLFYPFADAEPLRESVARALQASTLLFAICSALSLAVLNAYVTGLKQIAIRRLSDVRTLLEKIYDEFHSTKDQDLQEIVQSYVLPLLNFSTEEWLAYDPIRTILERITPPLERLHQRNPVLIPRHFLRLEDEINELGLLFVRRIISGLHAETIRGSFLLVCVGIVVIFTIAILPHSFTMSFVSTTSAMTVATLAILELAILVSYIQQEAREELPDDSNDV